MRAMLVVMVVLALSGCKLADPKTPEEEKALEQHREQLLQEMEDRKRERDRDRFSY